MANASLCLNGYKQILMLPKNVKNTILCESGCNNNCVGKKIYDFDLGFSYEEDDCVLFLEYYGDEFEN